MMEKSIFPVRRSILDSHILAKTIETAFGFSQAHCRLIKPLLSDIYDVWANNERYVLRVYRHGQHTPGQINAELDFLAYLEDEGLSVPGGITPRRGERLLTLQAPEGKRYAVLYTYIEGTPLAENLEPDTLFRVGQLIAHLHMAADTVTRRLHRPPLDQNTLFKLPLRALQSEGLLAHRPRDLAYLHRVASVLRTRMAHLKMDKPYYGLCHGDVDPSNIVIMADGHLAMIDFDTCGPGWRAYDIAALLAELQFRLAPEACARSFLEGYQSVRLLDESEMKVLPLFQVARNFWSLGLYATHVNEWGSYRCPDSLIDRLMQGIKIPFEAIEK